MSSHPKTEPPLEVWQFSSGTWAWQCWNCAPNYDGAEYDTHAEALAAALNHCAEATR